MLTAEQGFEIDVLKRRIKGMGYEPISYHVIEDVTHGLALTTRFGGGEPRFPSELSPAEWKEGR